MLSIILCDDEKEQRRHLRKVLSEALELKGLSHCFHEFDSGESFLADSRCSNADLVFLDIEMKVLDGMETARTLRQHNSAVVIVFVTAHDDYVFQGYDVKALNYILKPYHSERIHRVLDEALEVIGGGEHEVYQVSTKGGIYKISLKDVLYFMSDKRKVIAVSPSQRVEFYAKLDDIEKEFPAYFIRCHRRYLVNLCEVTEVEKDSLKVGNETIPVSRRQYQDLMIAFAKTMLKETT